MTPVGPPKDTLAELDCSDAVRVDNDSKIASSYIVPIDADDPDLEGTMLRLKQKADSPREDRESARIQAVVAEQLEEARLSTSAAVWRAMPWVDANDDDEPSIGYLFANDPNQKDERIRRLGHMEDDVKLAWSTEQGKALSQDEVEQLFPERAGMREIVEMNAWLAWGVPKPKSDDLPSYTTAGLNPITIPGSALIPTTPLAKSTEKLIERWELGIFAFEKKLFAHLKPDDSRGAQLKQLFDLVRMNQNNKFRNAGVLQQITSATGISEEGVTDKVLGFSGAFLYNNIDIKKQNAVYTLDAELSADMMSTAMIGTGISAEAMSAFASDTTREQRLHDATKEADNVMGSRAQYNILTSVMSLTGAEDLTDFDFKSFMHELKHVYQAAVCNKSFTASEFARLLRYYPEDTKRPSLINFEVEAYALEPEIFNILMDGRLEDPDNLPSVEECMSILGVGEEHRTHIERVIVMASAYFLPKKEGEVYPQAFVDQVATVERNRGKDLYIIDAKNKTRTRVEPGQQVIMPAVL